MAKKIALLIGVGEYGNGLKPLRCPVNGVSAMQELLENPEIGGFDEVVSLTNPDVGTMQGRIGEVFGQLSKNDLVLFYFTGHGIKDMSGNFYLSTTQTQLFENGSLNPGTAVAADFVKRVIRGSYAQRKVVILDCCFAAAFVEGITGMDDSSIDVEAQLGGKGWCVLTASKSTHYALEQEDEKLSVYTRYLVDGIGTGGAAADGQELIYIKDLHNYVQTQVKTAAPAMEPAIFNGLAGTEIAIAKVQVDNLQLYRKQVQRKVSNIQIRPAALANLKQQQARLKISDEDAAALLEEVLKPYREKAKHLEIFRQALIEEREFAYPLDEEAIEELEELKRQLNLRDEDVQKIKQDILSYGIEKKFQQSEPQKTSQEYTNSELDKNRSHKIRSLIADSERMSKLLSMLCDEDLLDIGKWSPKIVLDIQRILEQLLFASDEILFLISSKKTLKLGSLESFLHAAEEVTPLLKDNSSKNFLKLVILLTHYIQSNGDAQTVKEAILNHELKQHAQQPEPLQSSKLKPYSTFTFKTVRVDNKGAVLETKEGKAEYFPEDLGNGITLEMVRIPGGKFMMGASDEELGASKNEYPRREVTVPEFWMAKFAVTQEQWQTVALLKKIDRDLRSDPAKFKGAKRPVEQVSWEDAEEFCKRLSQQTRKKYTLPSEAQWEYACRARTNTPFHFGSKVTKDLVNYYDDKQKGTTEGGSLAVANSFGLYDMHGNVWEWCLDYWHENYATAPSNGTAWITNGDPSSRVLRGGSWDYEPDDCSSVKRNRGFLDIHGNDIGFRVVYSPP